MPDRIVTCNPAASAHTLVCRAAAAFGSERNPPAQQDLPAARIACILAETGAAHVRYRVAEVPVIKDIEELRSNLDGHPLGDRDSLQQGEVLIVQPRSAERVPPQIA